MSAERPPAVLDRALRAIAAGDDEEFVALCAEAIEIEPLLAGVEGGAYRGRDGVRQWLRDRETGWERVDIEMEPFRAAPGGWIAKGTVRAKSHSGLGVEQGVVGAVRLKDEQIAWFGFYRGEDEALERLRESG